MVSIGFGVEIASSCITSQFERFLWLVDMGHLFSIPEKLVFSWH